MNLLGGLPPLATQLPSSVLDIGLTSPDLFSLSNRPYFHKVESVKKEKSGLQQNLIGPEI